MNLINAMSITFNWLDLSHVALLLKPVLEGRRLDAWFIPKRPETQNGFLRNERALRLSSGKNQVTLIFRVEPKSAYVYATYNVIRPARPASRGAPFDAFVAKLLHGAYLKELKAIDRERVLWIRFSSNERALVLVLSLIPNTPEALLLEDKGTSPYTVLARTRMQVKGPYLPPDGRNAPLGLSLSDEKAFLSIESLDQWLDTKIRLENISGTIESIRKKIETKIKAAEKEVQSAIRTLNEVSKEPPWHQYGEALKAHLHCLPKNLNASSLTLPLILRDPETATETEKTITIPWKKNIPPSAQLHTFFERSKKNERKEIETKSRLKEAQAELALLVGSLASLTPETAVSIEKAFVTKPKTPSSSILEFTSIEGTPIIVGRDREENREVTFKRARGNDIWLHVRGRPGAHVVVLLQRGKTASLETLIDAATLAIHYSKLKKSGKIEVMYTFRKNVRAIPKSAEVTYSANKALLVDFDPERFKRLHAQKKQ